MGAAINTLDNLPSDRQEGEAYSKMLIHEIKSCKSPLPILVQLKVLEKVLKEVLTNDELDAIYLLQFKEYAKDNKLEVSGSHLTSQEYGAKYSFDTDQVWVILDAEIKKLTEQKKKREEVIKSDEIKLPGKIKVQVKL